MKKFFYAFYDSAGRPVVSVCLIQHEGSYARGLAICNPKDYGRLNKKLGYKIAEGRALKALEERAANRLINRRDTYDRLINEGYVATGTYAEWCFKSFFMPALTEKERLMIYKREQTSNDSYSDNE